MSTKGMSCVERDRRSCGVKYHKEDGGTMQGESGEQGLAKYNLMGPDSELETRKETEIQ